MSCCRDLDGEHCVCEVVKAINEVQMEVTQNACQMSCQQSIDKLLSPTFITDHDTIPFVLYCEGNCEAFEAIGNGFETIFFRVTDIDQNCCATLELLKGNFDELERTGMCITVDLSCFCAIQCLNPIKG